MNNLAIKMYTQQTSAANEFYASIQTCMHKCIYSIEASAPCAIAFIAFTFLFAGHCFASEMMRQAFVVIHHGVRTIAIAAV